MEQPMETEVCHNCKREVPQQNYMMHVAHCARNMAVCPVCGDAVPKAHLKEHRQKQHSLVECKDCRHKVQSGAMEHHKTTSCGKRKVACVHCELELPKSEMADHENYCGSRTERCDECGELVMLKYQKLHIDSNHGFLKLDDEPGPTPSWEIPTPASQRTSHLTQMSSLRSALPRAERTDPVVERNVNFAPVMEKADYKANFPPNSLMTPPPQRQPITPYDATEDLRAKVKLVRHDLNEIKQSYIMNEERKDRYDSKYSHKKNENLTTSPKKTEKFVTNLVPYEKNQSHKVNANLDENTKNYYNYLGEKEQMNKPFVPLENSRRNVFYEGLHNGETDKTTVKTKIEDPPKPAEREKRRVAHAGTSEKHSERHEHKEKKEKENGGSTGATPKKVTSPNGAVPKREQGAVPKRRKAPPPPVNIPKENPATPPSPRESDDVILPCEFCEEMIPASKLVQHETGCRPDLAQIKPAEKVSVPCARPQLSPEVELPCEFCFSLYPASKLLSHQALCDVELATS